MNSAVAVVAGVILIRLLAASDAFGQNLDSYSPDPFIAGMKIENLQRCAEFCYLSTKEREKHWLLGRRLAAESALNESMALAALVKNPAREAKTRMAGIIAEENDRLSSAKDDEKEAGKWLDKNCDSETTLYIFQRRRFDGLLTFYCVVRHGLVSNSCLLEFDDRASDADEKIAEKKRRELAEAIPWKWHDERATASYSIAHCPTEYHVTIEDIKLKEPDWDGDDKRYKLWRGTNLVCQWLGHDRTVFQIVGNRLYYAEFYSWGSGGNIAALDLADGSKLWDSGLEGIPPSAYLMYSNAINIEASKDRVTIYGSESNGTYVEIKDANTGRTIGHKIFTQLSAK